MRHAVAVGSKDAGFTMMEVMIALMILTIAITGLLATIIPASRLIMVNRETAIAMAAAMGMIEYMSDPDLFSDLFVLYNRKTGDDPAWWDPAPGQEFEVPGLDSRDGNPTVGKIHFPTYCTVQDNYETQELRENKLDQEYIDVGMNAILGLPRDLDGDPQGDPPADPVITDDDDHAGNYILLPVVIRLEWTGIAGPRSLMMTTLIAER